MHKILVVDDETQVAKALRRLFVREGFEVEVAHSGAQGLAALDHYSPHVIVSDFRMPEMNGAEFLTQAKLKSPQSTRIILSGQPELDQSTIGAGGLVYKFLCKPWDDVELIGVIRRAIKEQGLD